MHEMSIVAREKLAAFNEKQTDWYTTCPVCKAELQGTLKELREHKCPSNSH